MNLNWKLVVLELGLRICELLIFLMNCVAMWLLWCVLLFICALNP